MFKKIKNKKGFTLTELLVAILIIGILAAIALPQYQFMIDKAHFANLQRLGKSIKDAYDDYHGYTGEYPTDFSQLIVGFNGNYSEKHYTSHTDSEHCVVFPDIYCCIGKAVSGWQDANIFCGRNDYLFAWASYRYLGPQQCVAQVGKTRAENLCRKLGTPSSTLNLITPYGHNSNNGDKYKYYRIN